MKGFINIVKQKKGTLVRVWYYGRLYKLSKSKNSAVEKDLKRLDSDILYYRNLIKECENRKKELLK